MKKSMKTILTVVAVALIAVLVVINRNSIRQQEELANAKQLQIVVNSEESIYYFSETDDSFTTFDTQMKRRNGEITDRNYGGIQLADILADIDVTVTENTVITAVCADQYEVQFTADEVNADGNIYLVTQENGEALSEDSGSFMLVVNNDEFSTRWAKNIVQVKIGEK